MASNKRGPVALRGMMSPFDDDPHNRTLGTPTIPFRPGMSQGALVAAVQHKSGIIFAGLVVRNPESYGVPGEDKGFYFFADQNGVSPNDPRIGTPDDVWRFSAEDIDAITVRTPFLNQVTGRPIEGQVGLLHPDDCDLYGVVYSDALLRRYAAESVLRDMHGPLGPNMPPILPAGRAGVRVRAGVDRLGNFHVGLPVRYDAEARRYVGLETAQSTGDWGVIGREAREIAYIGGDIDAGRVRLVVYREGVMDERYVNQDFALTRWNGIEGWDGQGQTPPARPEFFRTFYELPYRTRLDRLAPVLPVAGASDIDAGVRSWDAQGQLIRMITEYEHDQVAQWEHDQTVGDGMTAMNAALSQRGVVRAATPTNPRSGGERSGVVARRDPLVISDDVLRLWARLSATVQNAEDHLKSVPLFEFMGRRQDDRGPRVLKSLIGISHLDIPETLMGVPLENRERALAMAITACEVLGDATFDNGQLGQHEIDTIVQARSAILGSRATSLDSRIEVLPFGSDLNTALTRTVDVREPSGPPQLPPPRGDGRGLDHGL